MSPSIAPNPKQSPETEWVFPSPDITELVTEDDTPVDNLLSEKQQRFLTSCLYSSLSRDIPFLNAANVGLFYGANRPSLVPDILLSFGISVPDDWSQKQNRSYFVWNFGKPPELAIEIVSNTVGNELGKKLQNYARAGVGYYVVFDPLQCLSEKILQLYELQVNCYILRDDYWLEQIELGLTLWQGNFEGKEYDRWLRWCDRDGNLLLTGDERADRFAQLLREQGINPDTIL